MVLRLVGFTIVMETMTAVVALAPEDLLCVMLALSQQRMPFVRGVLFSMHLVNSQDTQVVCCLVHSCFEGHTVVAIILETMVAAEDMLCHTLMMMTTPLTMPFIQGILFTMHLVNLQETQLVCR
jgi:hypothetical protein